MWEQESGSSRWIVRTPAAIRDILRCRDGTLVTANDGDLHMWTLVPMLVERDEAGEFATLLHQGLDLDSLMISLGTYNFYDFLISNDRMKIADLFKSHEDHLRSADMRVRSALRKEDLWACNGAPLGFMKFPTTVCFMAGDVWDNKPKIGFALYDVNWAGTTKVDEGGVVRVWIYNADSLDEENSLPIHINAYFKAFGELPGPDPRADFNLRLLTPGSDEACI
eukprot:UN27304